MANWSTHTQIAYGTSDSIRYGMPKMEIMESIVQGNPRFHLIRLKER